MNGEGCGGEAAAVKLGEEWSAAVRRLFWGVDSGGDGGVRRDQYVLRLDAGLWVEGSGDFDIGFVQFFDCDILVDLEEEFEEHLYIVVG